MADVQSLSPYVALARTGIAALARQIIDGDHSGLKTLFAMHGYPCPETTWDVESLARGDGVLESCLDAWLGQRGDDPVPRSETLEIGELKEVADECVALEVVDQGWEFIYSHYGRKLTEATGHDYTGMRTSSIGDGDFIAYFFMASCRAVMEARRPLLTKHCPPAETNAAIWRRLILPMRGPRDEILKMLVAIVPGPAREMLVEVYMAETKRLRGAGFNGAAAHPIALREAAKQVSRMTGRTFNEDDVLTALKTDAQAPL